MNEKLQTRLKGLQGAATAAGPLALNEWSNLYEGSALGEVTYADVRDLEIRLRNTQRQNHLDETLPPDRRVVVLPERGEQSISELEQLEKEASAECGLWVGRGPLLKL